MGSNATPGGSFDRFELWKQYEGIAMHFNDLIIRLRTQSLAAVAAFAAVASVVAKNDMAAQVRWGLLSGTFFLLLLFWIAIWLLDFGYYNRLLEGAVHALLELENASPGSPTVNEIDCSRRIAAAIDTGDIGKNTFRTAFYSVVLVALSGGLAASIYMLCMSST